VRSSLEDGRAVMEVLDSGPGVPLRERVFEPFFTTKDPGKGTGLGLSISRTIMRRYGGDLEIPQDAQPTVFRLWLPVEAVAKA
jgi:two-component system, NtrC family, sensor kinase